MCLNQKHKKLIRTSNNGAAMLSFYNTLFKLLQIVTPRHPYNDPYNEHEKPYGHSITFHADQYTY